MDERFVINIGRQIGSGGKHIGELLAPRLGVRLYDKELLMLAAAKSGLCPEFFERADERASRTLFGTLVDYLRAPFVGDDGAVTDVLSNDALFKIQSDVIRDLAAHESCIFVGRCADYILRDYPRAVNIFITGNDADRTTRLQQRHALSRDQARNMMERIDDKRASYYNYYSSRQWGVAATYDLCINSSSLGEAGTADLILDFVVRKLNMKF